MPGLSRRLLVAWVLMLLGIGLGGCGGSPPLARAPAARAAAVVPEPGRVQVQVLWPQRDLPGFHAKQIPLATNAIVLQFRDAAGQAPPGTPVTIARPDSDAAAAGQAEVTLARGAYTIDALAYRQASPAPGDVAIARATAANVQVRSGHTSSVPLSLTDLLAPFIDALSYNSGPVGSTLRLSGEHLRGSDLRVYFNATVNTDNTVAGTIANAPTVLGDGRLEVTVPAGAHSGNVVVLAGGVPSAGIARFFVLKALQLPGDASLPVGSALTVQPVGVDVDNLPVEQPDVVCTSSDSTIGDLQAGNRLLGIGGGNALVRCTDPQGFLAAQRFVHVLITTGAFATFEYFQGGPVRGLFAAGVGGPLYAVGFDGTAMLSTDRASSWSAYAPPPGPVSVSDATADPVPGNLYMGLTIGLVYVVPTGAGTSSWTKVSAGPVGGKTMPICAMTSDGIHLYVGLWDGTVYRTDVAGIGPASTWTMVGAGPIQPWRSVTRLRVAGGTLYAGLSLSYLGDHSSPSNVWQTALPGDGNSAWIAVGSGAQAAWLTVYSLVDDGSLLYAGTVDHLYATALAGSGAGSGWTEVGTGINGDTGQQGLWNVATLRGQGGSLELLAAVGTRRVYRTAGPGLAGSGTWSALGAAPGDLPGAANPVALLADNGDLFAGATNGLVYRLPAAGGWEQPNTVVIGSTTERVECLSSNGRHLFAGGKGGVSARPVDGSASWLRNNLGNLSVRVVAATAGGTFAAVDGYRIARVDTNVRNWSSFVPAQANIPTLLAPRSLVVAGSKLFAGGDDGSVWQTPVSAPAWSAAGTPAQGDSVLALAGDADWLVAATASGKVHRTPLTADGAPDWQTLSDYPGAGSAIKALLVVQGRAMVASADGNVYATGLAAGGWQVMGGAPVAAGAAVSALVTDGAALYAGTTGHGVYRLSLAGGSWSPFGGSLGAADITSLVLRGNHIFAGTSSDGVYWTL